jgi:hypothetical protein
MYKCIKECTIKIKRFDKLTGEPLYSYRRIRVGKTEGNVDKISRKYFKWIGEGQEPKEEHNETPDKVNAMKIALNKAGIKFFKGAGADNLKKLCDKNSIKY